MSNVTPKDGWSRFSELETDINDLERWTRICLMMIQHQVENPDDNERGSLGLVVAEKVDEMAAGLKKAYYAALERQD